MPWSQWLSDIQNVLADLYPDSTDAVRVAREAGLPIQHIAVSPKAINTWHEILTEASRRELLSSLLQIARRDYSEHAALATLCDSSASPADAPVVGADLPWKTPDLGDSFEKIIGATSALLPISFLELGLDRSRPVARICLDHAYGTGFLVQNNLLITNHHVLPDIATAEKAVAQFNVQRTVHGLDAKSEEYQLAPSVAFSTSVNDDWAVVKVDGDPNSAWGATPLTGAAVKPNDPVNIIQHPAGGLKQIAFAHNLVRYVGEGRVQYLTDTLPGSSGSPVFNNEWDLVAVHHSGGYIPEPGSKAHYYRNEGIDVRIILKELATSGLVSGNP
ncbi:MAG: trypsin-like peptidase domain-containing protein [Deltaproteobacteria bacterium]|nr:trypsin-like peptidase domain-containing protein [Deltaproteobacteria bacterium]